MSDSAALPESVPCIICHQPVDFEAATAGSLYADGRQAFACNVHITEHIRWTLSWIAFDIDQQATAEQTKENAAC